MSHRFNALVQAGGKNCRGPRSLVGAPRSAPVTASADGEKLTERKQNPAPDIQTRGYERISMQVHPWS